MWLNLISYACYFLIFVVFLWGIVDILHNKKSANLQSGLSAGLGMLGTFLGITYGLSGFDENDITASIPILLHGMKTAFWTSIWGMIGNMSLKFLHNRCKPKDDQTKGKTESEAVISLLSEIANNGKENSALMKNIEKSISGDGETTLNTNIEKLRNITRENLSELNKSFKEFAQTQAENNTKALIEALESVMRDFNTKINEQFGDNFKKFNEALGIMLEWQKNYKEQLEKMSEQFELAKTGIDKTRTMVSDIVDSQSVFQNTADALDVLLKNLNTNLVGMKNIADKASDVFPIIHENIKNLTENLSAGIKNSNAQINEMLKGQIDGMREQKQIFIDAYKNFETESRNISAHTNQKITEQIKSLDAALSKELTEALEQFGKSLVQISNKFVEVYRELPNAISDIKTELKRRN
ncbi:MAG: hypothetical protein FWF51_04575 [Chitinivibrionia bacterium]|nr:hypothetical protein [Chitinivibrionia bacterium]